MILAEETCEQRPPRFMTKFQNLNIIHLHIKGTGFLMENRDTSPLVQFVKCMTNIFYENHFKTKLNKHIENEVGDIYRTALSYMDTERDKNTIKFILTRITSINL